MTIDDKGKTLCLNFSYIVMIYYSNGIRSFGSEESSEIYIES